MVVKGRAQKRKESSIRNCFALSSSNDEVNCRENAATKIKKARSVDSQMHADIRLEAVTSSSAGTAVFQESSKRRATCSMRQKPCHPNHLQRGSCNVMHHLIVRSMTATRHKIPLATRLSWRPCSNVEFFLDRRMVSHMEWDPMGVLLAVAFEDYVVRIYDWDMVRAAEMKGRTKTQRDKVFAMTPIIEIPVKLSKIVMLKWNPSNHDELLVGTKFCPTVHVYDLAQVVSWQRHVAGGRVPVSRSIRVDCNLGHAGVAFVDNGKRVILPGDDNTLHCYSLVNHLGKRIWKLTWRRVTCVVPVCDDMLLLGSSTGHLALLNWKETERAPFSLHPTPILRNEFLSYRGLGSPQSDSTACHMGIRELWTNHSEGTGEWQRSAGRLQISWITNCGWMLSTELDVESSKFAKSIIISSTTPIKRMNSNGDEISISREHLTWSIPDKSVLACTCADLTVWENVPDTIEHLPIHDARVLLAQPRIVRLKANPALRYKVAGASSIGTVQLSKRRGSPTCISIHPSQQWIVVATEQGYMYFFNSRPKLK